MEEQRSKAILRVATKRDFPKKYIHKSTLLITPDAYDSDGEVFWVWVTASPRRNCRLKLSAYVGGARRRAFDPSLGGDTRECISEALVNNWSETKEWIAELSTLRCQIDHHTEVDLANLIGVFAKLVPQWFLENSQQ